MSADTMDCHNATRKFVYQCRCCKFQMKSYQILENGLGAAWGIDYAPWWTYPAPKVHSPFCFRCRDEEW